MSTDKKRKKEAGAGATLPIFYDGITEITSGAGWIAVPGSVINLSGSNTWSMEIWVNPDLLVDNAQLLGCTGEFALSAAGSTIVFSLNGQPMTLTAQNQLEANSWTHVAVTCDSNAVVLYVNGIVHGQLNMVGGGPASSGNTIQVGGGFYGQLDSFRLWSIAVQANAIGDNQFVDYPANTRGLQAQIDLTQNPPVDTSGQHVSISQSTSGVNYVSYIPSVYLEGTAFADTYADGNVNPAGSASDFSILSWVFPTAIGSEMAILTNGVEESTAGMSLMITANGNVEFQVGQSTALVSNSQLSPGSWYNVSVTWSASTTTGTIYINGTFDSSNAGMALGGTLATGSIMLGAEVSNQSIMPVSTFTGYIQLVSVWNYALTAAQVQSNLNVDPLTQGVTAGSATPGCIADYNLAMLPAQNTISGNPLGLVAGASPSLQGIASNLNLGGLLTGPIAGDLKRLSGPPQDSFPEHWLEEGAFDVMLRDIMGTLQGHKLTTEQEEALGSLMQENFQRAFADMKAGTYSSVIGDVTYTPEMLESARQIALKANVPITCVQCIVGVLIAIFGLLLAVFSIPINGTTLTRTMLNYLNNLPWIQSLVSTIQALMPAGNPNPGALLAFLKQVMLFLYNNSMLSPMLQLAYQAAVSSISIWTITTITARLIIYIFPGAGQAWLFAQLAYSIVSLGIAINNCSGCTSSTEQRVLPRVSVA